jgi:hypothetical protein
VTVAAERMDAAAGSRAGLAPAKSRPLFVPGRLRRATAAAQDLLGAVALVLSVPFVILAVGIPVALCVRLLVWIVGML